MAHKTHHDKHKLRQIHARKGGKILEADVESSFIDSVSLDKDAGIVTVTIGGVDYEYVGDRNDFQGIRREGGAYFNENLRPQNEK
jgi:hypothetical protein